MLLQNFLCQIIKSSFRYWSLSLLLFILCFNPIFIKSVIKESSRIDEKNNDSMKELATKTGTKFTSFNSDRPASSGQTSNNNSFNHLTSSNGNTNACSIGINTNQLENSSACLLNNVPHSSWQESVELSSSNNSLSLNKAPPPPTVAKPMVAYLQIPSQYFPWFCDIHFVDLFKFAF